MEKYDWKFSTIGGVTRVNIDSGDDIRHLGELDQKLWTVLSCPVKGLELDERTLELMDTNNDGMIHVNEVIAAAEWLCKVLKDPEQLLRREDTLPFPEFNTDDAEGRALLASARQILSNLGLEKESISVADTSDSIAIFAKTKFNGDGIVTPESTDDEALKDVISKIVSVTGGIQDRSGVIGVNAGMTENFYAELAAYAGWVDAGKANAKAVFPYGDDTAAAWDACTALKDKIADFFMRCKLASFLKESASVLDISPERIGEISGKDLSDCDDEISEYPLFKVDADCLLPLDGGVNPAWKDAFANLKRLVLDSEFAGKKAVSEDEWLAVLAKFDAYNEWVAAKAGASVEQLGCDTAHKLLKDNLKDALLKLIDKDLELKSESESIDAVNKLTHLYRDFYTLLCNFVTMKDFYNPAEYAVFQAGKLYIDQRCCELCIKVSDLGRQISSAGLSNMYIAYCNCVSKHSPETMTIAAVVTGGDVNNLREGKNAIFYDRDGLDWDATVIKVLDNPISIRQAFWRPYRRLGEFIEKTVNKFASDKDAKSMDSMTEKVSASAEGGAKPSFDIGRFAGIFAALSLALAAILGVLAAVVAVLAKLVWWKWLILIAAIMLIISTPSMIMAWLKLRKRNLSPVLNANGWAVNARIKVNIPFGATLTSIAEVPKMNVGSDPYRQRMPAGVKWLIGIVAAAAIFCALYFTNTFYGWGIERLHFERKARPDIENVSIQPDPVALITTKE
ncbi:MAG: hypothetical protein J5732_08375 [Bacteroidaceae bacterium]|nr:hypothetical protein [Bacteroidaceae bacterium]